ncbi:MAG: helix-turn-helix transcriptional regulator [Clostridia bacterium]|nr:helix-turn-helix transcriptional regulator [Clostridia bacterium]
MKLSDNLRNIRKEHNLSQEQLAEKIGVSRQAVSKWESGQSYPEMDKVLLICKLFNYNIDELMNENVKEVNETKQSKININKYIDDFFGFITKTVDMLTAMSFKEKVKCFIEQAIIIIFLVAIFAIIGTIGSSLLSGLFRGIHSNIYFIIRNILETIYIILALFMGVTIFLHIFKIRYLDYYEIIKEDSKENNEINNEETNNVEIIKDLNDKKEKIIIRDPNHTSSKFLSGILRITLWGIKFIVACFAIGFVFSFVGLVAALIISFLFVKTGLVFAGSLLGIIAALTINYIILELCFNFIVSKKSKVNRMAIVFISSLILGGISIGLVCIGMTQFNYIDNPSEINQVEDVFEVKMKENLSIDNWNDNIEYIETDSNEVKIVIKHSKYHKAYISNHKDNIILNYYEDDTKIMDIIRDSIKDINNKEIKNYYEPEIYVYTSKDNINKIKQNELKRINSKYNEDE